MTISGFGTEHAAAATPATSTAVPEDAQARTVVDVGAEPDFERLRELLIGAERRALDEAHARIAELEKAQRELPRRLPDALDASMRIEHTNVRVADALAVPVAQALGVAVRNNRQGLIDALFPVIGPLIRKAIAEALRSLVADLNGAIESSFTPRGVKWRIEAWRAGVPYAQVVLKHRLDYRIDHVFLIERRTGLVLCHEAAPDLPPLDADAIAGMLTALGDFVDDSVGAGSGGTLESARVGEHLVWVVQGPRANLACFMRGIPPAELRERLEQRLEEIHSDFAELPEGADVRSDSRAVAWHDALQPASLMLADDSRAPPSRRASRWPWLLALLLILIALTWFFARREQWDARVDALRARLVAQPGFVLQRIDSTPWRALTVHGLLDPDAAPLSGLFASARLGAIRPKLDSAGYLSTDDAVIARRAARLLVPPAGVRVAVAAGVLKLEGSAPTAWIAATRERAGWIAGVREVDFALTPDTSAALHARAEIDQLAQALPAHQVLFDAGTQAVAGATAVVDDIVRVARRALALEKTANVRIAFVSAGSSDDTGNDQTNARVREARARWLAQALVARDIPRVTAAEAGGEVGTTPTPRRSAYLRMTISAPAK